MNPASLATEDGVVLTDILRRKAADLNAKLGSSTWTRGHWKKCFGRTMKPDRVG
jgi:hypothetical protein